LIKEITIINNSSVACLVAVLVDTVFTDNPAWRPHVKSWTWQCFSDVTQTHKTNHDWRRPPVINVINVYLYSTRPIMTEDEHLSSVSSMCTCTAQHQSRPKTTSCHQCHLCVPVQHNTNHDWRRPPVISAVIF